MDFYILYYTTYFQYLCYVWKFGGREE